MAERYTRLYSLPGNLYTPGAPIVIAAGALLKDNQDFVYIHVEAPDEMGHQGNAAHKVQSIEEIDKNIVSIVKNALDSANESYRILILPDHPTPICMRTHTSDPVPYLLYDSTKLQMKETVFTEKTAEATGVFQSEGHHLLDLLIQ